MERITTENVWKELRERLFAFIRRRVGSEDDASDVLQEVFLRIHANARRHTEVENVTGWVHRIARNAIVDHHRAKVRDASVMEPSETALEADWEPLATPDVGDPEPTAELARCIEPLLERLPEPYARAVVLVDLRGLEQGEAARRSGLSTSGMKSRVQRGRSKLKEVLLDCCEVELDRRRGVLGFERRRSDPCGEGGCG